jgi:hypothetical protein
MVDDFRCLAEVVEDNYPFLWSVARSEGYDWRSHRPEFEQAVSEATSDAEFAAAIYRAVRSLNNGHTSVHGAWAVQTNLADPAKRWAEEARKTSPDRAEYWARLAGASWESGKFLETEPFAAVYLSGDYVVAGVSPDPRATGKVQAGWKVLALNDEDVHRFAAGQRGRWWLKYDPLRGRVYLSRLTVPQAGEFFPATFETTEGRHVTARLPRSVEPWPDPYHWPPRYTGQAEGSVIHTAVIGGKAAYLQVKQMGATQSDSEAIRTFLDRARTLPALVMDIRGNGGGGDLFWMENLCGVLGSEPATVPFRIAWRSGRRAGEFVDSKMMANLAAFGLSRDELSPMNPASCQQGPPELRSGAFGGLLEESFPVPPAGERAYRGKVFLLVDDDVFSSAEKFAVFCKASGWATLVGEVTGGDGIGFDPSSLALPRSGMYILYATVMGLNPDWSVNDEVHTRPDVLVERSADDLLRYIRACNSASGLHPDPSWDPVLKKCLSRMGA